MHGATELAACSPRREPALKKCRSRAASLFCDTNVERLERIGEKRARRLGSWGAGGWQMTNVHANKVPIVMLLGLNRATMSSAGSCRVVMGCLGFLRRYYVKSCHVV